MDDVPLCPDWWPKILWDLHFKPRPGGDPPNPVNYPPAIDDIMAGLTIHTMSYLLLDKGAAQELRARTEKQLITTVQQMSALHDRAIG